MKRSYRIQDGKILIYQEIELTDHAQYLKFDWHLYNLSKDIDEENEAHLQSSVFKLSKDLIDSIHEEGIVAYTS